MDQAPAVDTLLPHAPPMQLLDAVLLSSVDWLVAGSSVELCRPLLGESPLPSLLGLELLAQAAALYAGLASAPAAAGNRPEPGMLLGARRFEVATPAAAAEQLLVAVTRRSPLGRGGMAKFSGAVYALTAEQGTAVLAELRDASDAPAELTRTCAAARIAAGDLSVYLPAGAVKQ